jgi:hypothetical protein
MQVADLLLGVQEEGGHERAHDDDEGGHLQRCSERQCAVGTDAVGGRAGAV